MTCIDDDVERVCVVCWALILPGERYLRPDGRGLRLGEGAMWMCHTPGCYRPAPVQRQAGV